MKPCFINKKIAGLLILSLLLQACEKFVQINPAPDLIDTSALFTSDATALAAANSVYVLMRESSPSLANGTLSVYSALSADELKTTSADLEFDAFENNSVLATSEVISLQIWSAAYRVIYRTNSILENLEKSKSLSISIKNQLAGEMLVVRALHYFYLVNLFGNVPLIISSDYRESESKSRTPVSEINQQLIKDLSEAGLLLTESYPSPGKQRPNKYTAMALLARVNLYLEDWPAAEAMSTLVIVSGKYELVGSLPDVFRKNSPETIWEIASANESRNTAEGNLFIPPSLNDVPVFYFTPSLLTAFETDDSRKTNWAGVNVIAGNEYYYPFKYKAPANDPVSEYEIVSRLAEQYLIRAEARARQNNLAGASADLNMIRSRALLPNSSATDQNALLVAIQKERQVELFSEWGHRWLDLKRIKQDDKILGPIKGSAWQSEDKLYPIPFSELQLNPLLVQNPGY